jgi:hypothetical protein
MKLVFAACARDCAEVVAANISALLLIGDLPWCDELLIYIVENSSKDNTRDVISCLAEQDPRVIPFFLDDLDELIPVRASRIAFCRDLLLDEIHKTTSDALYIPIDLDLDIASSFDSDAFMKSCRLVASGQCTGLFPSSLPYYYDLHALREADWCPKSCWKEIYDANAKGALWNLLVFIRYVSLRQKSHAQLRYGGLISIDSAFGGVGIYSLSKVSLSGARYSSPDLEKEHLKVCEHVVFNAYLCNLFINPDWAISAPVEHIAFNLLTIDRKLVCIIRAGLVDVKSLFLAFAKFVKRLKLQHIRV